MSFKDIFEKKECSKCGIKGIFMDDQEIIFSKK
jgi:hypothetical protein